MTMNKVLAGMLCAAPLFGAHAAANAAGAPLYAQSASSQVQDQRVYVQINQDRVLTFDGPVRLDAVWQEALTTLDSESEIYWPGVRLIQRDGNADIQQAQVQLSAEYAALADYWQEVGAADSAAARKAQLATHLSAQIQAWQLAAQPYAGVDLNPARFSIADNPLLGSGQYVLLTEPRATDIPIYGAIEPLKLRLRPGQSVRNYMQSIPAAHWYESTPLPFMEKRPAVGHGEVTLVRRGQAAQQLPVAFHNAQGDELQPGDLLWVAPQHALYPREFRHLQGQAADLLQHWLGSDDIGYQALDAQAVNNNPVRYWENMDMAPGRNHYGGVGLLQNPTARMGAEGETILMYSDTDEYRRYTVSMQVLPWLQASAFYTRIPNRLYSSRPDFSGTNILTDKGFDVKFRVWQESYWAPEVSVGFNDFAGTGLFDGEYVVASKRAGPFDFSFGLGFGRDGTRGGVSNPFCELSDSFCQRSTTTQGTGSQLDFGRYFRGPASLFGGVEYQTPWQPLSLMLEYDGNDYSADRAGVPIDASNPWNIGARYRVSDWLDTTVSFERGDTLMFNLVLRTNFNTLSQIRIDSVPVQPEPPEVELADVDWNATARRIHQQRALSGVRVHMPDEETVRVVAYPWRYRDYNEAIDRSARILADSVPESVTRYEFESQSVFEPMVLTSLDANAFKRRINNEDAGRAVDDTNDLFVRTSPEFNYQPDNWLYNPERSRRVGYGLNPFFNQDFGSPETFHFYQLGVKAFASTWLTDNLNFFGEIGINLKNNYDRFKFERDPFDFPLPRVRTDFRLHATNDAWVDNLQLTYFKRLSENVYGSAYAGYLERFFAGVGGELLYREVDSPWAFGVNVNRVRQRDYNGWFGFENYETTMGHASVYYQMPWLKDSMLRLDVGRFLAGDDGVGVTFARRFDSGVVVSAYASFTDVPSEVYGEGSFTHGFSVSVPFELIAIRPTRQRVSMSWSPMSRDGGQPLWRRYELYGITDDRGPFWNR